MHLFPRVRKRKLISFPYEKNLKRKIHIHKTESLSCTPETNSTLSTDYYSNVKLKKKILGVPTMAQRKQILLLSMRVQVQSVASLSGLRIQHCHELWCRSPTQLRSYIAVAVV